MTRELKHITLGLMLCFALVAMSAAYWGIFEAEGMLAREDNPRRVIAERNLERGKIVDRNDVVLASGRQGNRRYPHEGVTSAIGYYNYRYGAAGLEASFDDLLQGEWRDVGAWQALEDDLFHRATVGYDLRSTIDLTVQQAVDTSIGERRGAAVVVHVPSGQIWAMVSHPTPDLLNLEQYVDENGQLIDDVINSPLYNRVRQGGYQPGGVMYLVLLAGMLNVDVPLDTPTPDALQPIDINQPLSINQIGCLAEPSNSTALTLIDAFIAGCPQPFAVGLGTILTYENYQSLLATLGLLEAPPLVNLDTAINPTPAPLNATTSIEDGQRMAIGQGALTLNPLQVARLLIAIANQGNVPSLVLADAYRPDASSDWIPLELPTRRPALLRTDVALQLKTVLELTAERSPLLASTQRTDVTIRGYTLHGQVSVAYAGESMVSWFTGFIVAPDGSAFVVVVVIEDATSPDEAAQVAGDAFQAVVLANDPAE